MSITKNRIILLALATAAALGIALGIAVQQTKPALQSELKAATLYPDDFRPLAPFQLTDHDGRTFDNSRLQDRWSLLFFGFTYCPDVCPLTLQILQDVDREIAAQADGKKPQVVFVSVDPERDTPERLRQYVGYFHPDFTGVSGDHSNLQALTRSLGAFYTRSENPQQPDRYQVDHSAALFLLGPDGRIRALFSAPLQAGAIARDLLTIIQHG